MRSSLLVASVLLTALSANTVFASINQCDGELSGERFEAVQAPHLIVGAAARPAETPDRAEDRVRDQGIPQMAVAAGQMQIRFRRVVRLADNVGKAYFGLIRGEIDRMIDEVAHLGFEITSADDGMAALNHVDPKVRRNAIKAAGSEEAFRAVLTALAGRTLTFDQIPAAIQAAGVHVSSTFRVANFIGLVSGGGVAVEIAPGIYAYNVGYASGEHADDERSGRTYIEYVQVDNNLTHHDTPVGFANDASDEHLLQGLADYPHTANANPRLFIQAVMDVLLMNDTVAFQQLTPAGKAAAIDVLGVIVAEADRHLMSGMRMHPWEIPLVFATLLAPFHWAQNPVMMMYNGFMSNQVPKAEPTTADGTVEWVDASLVSDWRFSNQIGSTRSGVNLGHRDQTLTAQKIADYENAHHPQLIQAIQSRFTGIRLTGEPLTDLSSYLFRMDAPDTIPNARELSNALVDYVMQYTQDSAAITAAIVASQPATRPPLPRPRPAAAPTHGGRPGGASRPHAARPPRGAGGGDQAN